VTKLLHSFISDYIAMLVLVSNSSRNRNCRKSPWRNWI